MAPSLRIVRADFETSAAEPAGWPGAIPNPEWRADDGTMEPDEIAFVGRSNVGKSSLLNSLVERRGLARTSSEPGRTRLVNFFQIELLDGPTRRLLRFVDLPGFGYAKVSKTERATWRPAIERYLAGRQTLRAVVLLVDARRVPEAKEREGDVEKLIGEEHALLDWIAGRGVEVIPVLTKCDKLAKHERTLVADRLKRLFGRPVILASATTLEGRERLWARIVGAVTAPESAPVAPLPAGLTPSDPTD